jgi:hypothetical protein
MPSLDPHSRTGILACNDEHELEKKAKKKKKIEIEEGKREYLLPSASRVS